MGKFEKQLELGALRAELERLIDGRHELKGLQARMRADRILERIRQVEMAPCER